jgi:hypothetical protein
MPTPTQYDFTQQVDYSSVLVLQIQQSSISTALDHIDTSGSGPTMSVMIWFKDVLSTADQTTLNSVMAAYVNVAPPPVIPSVAVSNVPVVTTQYELNNKDLKLARASGEIDPTTSSVLISMQIPGAWGTGPGRYIEGGYAITEDYDKDDYCLIWVSDDDRNIAMTVALAMNPSATTPVADSVIQGMGVVPGIGFAMPNYPVVKTYYDDNVASANAGWYFWPLAQGDGLPPVGETEVESIAGYAFGPSGLYLKIQYSRATKTTGGIRINFSWARLG